MTLPPNPADKLNDAPLDDLIRVLMSQFKRLLADHGTTLTADETLAVSRAIASGDDHPKLADIRAIMKTLVQDSLDLLDLRWNLSFEKSLYADMNDIGAWDSTAEFLDIANEKSNAELRVSAGSALLVAMGEGDYVPYLLQVIKYDNGVMDVDAMFAKRALLHLSGVDPSTEDWLEQVKQWLAEDNNA